ncbi:DUF788-domain-containing protein [Tilletiaria anomala UBC 951]|uniref:DUF788-domain-containing protein n=1 Tax=Tilletiaria anomala (strain ATCC 24038 / CBS 436.72 / UBC 951) TaxID=1037660 RepID=A0A066WGE8_TILAU|nr:DUF788-domain-containing protein [Tilletiaria anomala UBC 951]KDN53062.1 DUF788-domain-containing protein [Tilletiaria anomala UBC 951]
MARAAAKRVSSQNASTLATLLYGFLISSTMHVLFRFVLYRSTASTRHVVYFVLTEALAVALWLQLQNMAKSGDDLAQGGLTAYMFDIIYVTWAVHVLSAAISSKFWWLYMAIPAYAIFILYRKALVPFVLGGRDPLARIFSALRGGSGKSSKDSGAKGQEEDATQGMSKRQQKLQKRQEKGDPRVQVRRR